ncbi:MAG: NFACT RNA binding domain-containing protein [Chitinispirillales bacterium]|jgi:predicted ribosome quality control (RQC) complex YloA/Tae2 family protein|nr:NFACT RNA binding domain-containing protein [Chitinispirillales bacterium]
MKSDEPSNLEQIRAIRHKIKALLKHELRKLEKQKQDEREAGQYLRYSQMADSLMADPSAAPRGTAKALIENAHTGEIEEIALNPGFHAVENAELLYRKARKGKRGHETVLELMRETETKVTGLREIIERIDKLINEKKEPELFTDQDAKHVRELTESFLPQETTAAGQQKNLTKTEKIPFKRFVIDGWEIFLGNNSTQNDELSTRFAKPSDIWLHVAGHAGSHVVIRRPKNTPPPPAEVIYKAAQLAVWFSKAKHTSFAEVHVTEARFVHKRRHAPAGEVIAERCKSVRVEPKNPQDMF